METHFQHLSDIIKANIIPSVFVSHTEQFLTAPSKTLSKNSEDTFISYDCPCECATTAAL